RRAPPARPGPVLRPVVAAGRDELQPGRVGDRRGVDPERRQVDHVRGPFVLQCPRLRGGATWGAGCSLSSAHGSVEVPIVNGPPGTSTSAGSVSTSAGAGAGGGAD